MKKTTLIVVATTAIICIAALIFSGYIGQKEGIPSKEDLVLSNYPKLFEKDVVIVIGENASWMEYESAEAIAENLHTLTGNMPVIKSDTEFTEGDKVKYNLILVGGPRTNRVLEEVYEVTDATRVTSEYPGASKGVLEILRNPWNEKKAMLLVKGSNEWGVKAAVETLERSKVLDKTSVISKWEESEVTILPNVTKTPTPVKYKPVTSHNEAIELANDYLNTTLGSDFVKSHFEVLGIDERPDMPSVWLVLYKYKSSGYEIDLSLAVDVGVSLEKPSRIIKESDMIGSPQEIKLSQSDAETIASEEGLAPPYSTSLSLYWKEKRIAWGVTQNSVKTLDRTERYMIDAENGEILEKHKNIISG